MRYLLTLIFFIALVSPPALESAQSSITITIDRFVANLYPKGSHYFWVINNTTTESPEEMIIDINTSVRNMTEDTLTEDRFLLLLIKGNLFAAQKIPLNAKVDCGKEEDI
jgi:hypothetical protein